MERFWSRVDKAGDCWLWTGVPTNSGYGSLTVNGRTVGAHVYAYTERHGPVPEGLELDHAVCHTRLCVNPDHLEPVTHAENCRRRAARVTHCPAGHEYSGENVRVRGRSRKCRRCDAARARANRAAMNTVRGVLS